MPWFVIAVLAAILASGCGTAAGPGAPAPPKPGTIPRLDTPEARRRAFTTAYRLIRNRDDAQARPLLEGLLGHYPDLDDYCLHYLALSEARNGHAARALDLWARLAAEHPNSVHLEAAALERGRIWRAQGNLEAARPVLSTAREAADRDVRQAAMFELAELAAAAGDPGAAQAELTALRRAAPGTTLGKQAKHRVEELRARTPGLAPHGADLENELRILLSEHDYANAVAAANELLATAPEAGRPSYLQLRAEAERGRGDLNQAVATLREIARRYPQSPAAPAALLRAATWLWNRDRNTEAEQGFRDFLRRFPRDAHAADALYAIGRIEQTAGRSTDAVTTFRRLAKTYPRAAVAREGRWRIGWILYQQQHWRAAADAFDLLARGGTGPHAADAWYWRARSLEHAQQPGAAAALYRRILDEAPASYYADWAERRLGQSDSHAPTVVAATTVDAIGNPPAGPPDAYHLTRARELQAAGLRAPAVRELRAFERTAPRSPELTRFLLDAYRAADGFRDLVRLRRGKQTRDPRALYPLAFWPLVTQQTDRHHMNPLFVVALMRQESLFDPEARSPANARGLMQLMPQTAERVAHELGRTVAVEDLYDPETNITLGVGYLQQLLRRYNDDWLKAVAAYNAGEDAVAKWQHRFGSLEPDEWVESITYRETRDYVKKVLSNYRRYRQLYASP